jgi:hypothetical protein
LPGGQSRTTNGTSTWKTWSTQGTTAWWLSFTSEVASGALTPGSELRFGIVNTVAGGLIRRMQVFMTPAEALEAAGLRE